MLLHNGRGVPAQDHTPALLYHLPTDAGEQSPLDTTAHAERVASLVALVASYEATKVPQVTSDPHCPPFVPLDSADGKWIGPWCDGF